MQPFSTLSLFRSLHAILLFFALYSGASEVTNSRLIASAEEGHSIHQLSPDGRYLVYLTVENNIETLKSVATEGQGVPIKLTPSILKRGDEITTLVISPNGQYVVYKAVINEQPKLEYLFSARLDGSTPPLLLAQTNIGLQTSGLYLELQFSDDSQYLVYSIDNSGNQSARRVFRVPVEGDPQQTVNITQALVGRVEFQTMVEYGFVPLSNDVYLLTSKTGERSSRGWDGPQTLVIHTDTNSTPKLSFSVTGHSHHFLDDGQHLLLFGPDTAGIRQLFMYNRVTGIRTRLSTSKTHNNSLFRTDLNELDLQVYGDWVLYYPQGPAAAPLSASLLPKPCFLTHLQHPDRDRKISDNCHKAKVLLAQHRIIYNTFTGASGELVLPEGGTYDLMAQSIEKDNPAVRLATGRWNAAFQRPDIHAVRMTPDGQWARPASFIDNAPNVQWVNLNNTEQRLNWVPFRNQNEQSTKGSYPLFTLNATRIMTDQLSSVPAVLQHNYDPLVLPDIPASATAIHRPMVDNCRVFSSNNQRYYMSECDRPWTELWWNPDYSGQGLRVQQIDDRIFTAWFTYDSQGQPTWVTLSGRLENNELHGDLKRFSGPVLGTPWNIDQVQGTSIGKATLKLKQNRISASFDYTIGETSGHLDLQPFYQGSSNQYDGFWWQKETNGQGVQIYHKGDQLFGCIYLYDEAGKNFWVTFQGKQIGNRFTAQLKRFTGPHFGDVWNINQVRAEVVGEITLQMISMNTESLISSSSPDFIAMDYTINGKTMHLDLERFRF